MKKHISSEWIVKDKIMLCLTFLKKHLHSSHSSLSFINLSFKTQVNFPLTLKGSERQPITGEQLHGTVTWTLFTFRSLALTSMRKVPSVQKMAAAGQTFIYRAGVPSPDALSSGC